MAVRIKARATGQRQPDWFGAVRLVSEWISGWRVAHPEFFDRSDRLANVRRRLPLHDLSELRGLADALRWRPHPAAKAALLRRSRAQRKPYSEVKVDALVTGILLAFAESHTPQRVRFGKGDWFVDDDEQRVQIVPAKDLPSSGDFDEWFRKEAINLAEADVLEPELVRHSGRGARQSRTRNDDSLLTPGRIHRRERLILDASKKLHRLSPLEIRLVHLYSDRIELTYAGAAKLLATTEPTVKTAFRRLRKKFP